jgi:membrane protease YdiL (CAAX protease family)
VLPATSSDQDLRAPFSRLRHMFAWVLCFSFFFMIPMEFSLLEWEKTTEGLWRIQSAAEPTPWIGLLFFFWLLITFVVSVLFVIIGSIQGFSFEKKAFPGHLEGLEIVYYFAWVQLFTWLALLFTFFIPGNGQWLDAIFAFLPHMIMLAVAIAFYHRSWETLGFCSIRFSRWITLIVVVAALYLLLFYFLDPLVTEPVAQFFQLDRQSWREDELSAGIRQAVESGWGVLLFQCVMIGVLGPIAEEVLFRGLILQGLLQRMGLVFSVVFSALIFALFHVDVAFFAPLFVMGLVMGGLYVWFRTLWAPILFHVINNSVSVLLDVIRA